MQEELAAEPGAPAGSGGFRRRVVVSFAALAVAGAVAAALLWPREPARVAANFLTDAAGFEATLLLDGEPVLWPDGTPMRTPCTVDDRPARPHHVVLKHDQWPDRDLGEIDFGETRQVMVLGSPTP